MEYAFRGTVTRVLVVVAVLALFTGTLWSQGGTGELTGLVTDPSGAVVVGAQVTLTNSATGEKRVETTTSAGIYHFSGLQVVGTYAIEITAKSFKGYKIGNIIVSVGVVTTHDAKLEVGAAGETVTVEAGAQLVQTTDSSLSGVVGREVWQSMPLETRSQNEFIGLLAGAEPAAQANLGSDRGAAVDGTRSGTGNFLVEGFDNNDQGLGGGGSLVGPGGANTTISPDAIQEYRVIEHVAPAEFGKAGGFVTDTVLKSGTNQWHGSLFEYNRIQALAANDFFSDRASIKDHLVRNQFGGSVGGPIIKDKSFFYFTTEIHHERSSAPVQSTSTTPDFLNFVSSGAYEQNLEGTGPYAGIGILCGNIVAGTASCPGAFPDAATLGPIFTQLKGSEPFPLCVPGTSNCTNLLTGSNGLYTFGAVYGLPGAPIPIYGSLTLSEPNVLNQTRYTGKFDQKLGAKDQLNVAYLYDNADQSVGLAGGAATFGVTEIIHGRAQNAGVTWSHTFSPTILNQARMSYTRHTANFPGDPGANKAQVPTIFTGNDPLGVGFGNNGNLPQFFTENDFTYKDDLSVTHGKHNFKGGGSYNRTRNGSSFQAVNNGLFAPYTVEDLVTDNKVDDNFDQFFFGGPVYGSVLYAEATINPSVVPATPPTYYRGFRANEVAAYIQDDWRVTPRLTLNIGLRWDYFGPPHNYKSGIDSNFYSGSNVTPLTCNFGTTAAPNIAPCNDTAVGGNPYFPANNPVIAAFGSGALAIRNHEIWNKDTNNFAPRFGFAWDTLGNQKMVVRGGYGIAYDRMYNNIFENIRFNPPYFCFCLYGTFINGVAAGANWQPGLYAVPFNGQGLFNSPTLFPNGIPKTSPRAIDQNLVTAYYEQAYFGFQYEVTKDTVLETNFVGTYGHKLLGILNLNTYPGRTSGAGSTKRPNPAFNSINLRTNCCSSNYDALQVTLRKRFSGGLSFNANYTYSKALDDLSDVFTPRGAAAVINPTDSLNPQLDYGPADFNVKHRIVGSYTYDLPFLKGNRWIGGWSLSGIVSFQTGSPFSIASSSTSNDPNKNGTFNDRLQYIGPGGLSNAYTGGNPANGYFKTADFQTLVCPANINGGLFCEGRAAGQLGRNSLVGPKFFNWDFGIGKRFKVTENTAVTLQGNFFNILNHPNFRLPGTDPNASNYGASASDFGARVTQLSLRYDF
ncbi:MAG TPA: TonB-dependent receptor [Candidatus Acidoferrum sp.]|jgi:hypothetical protein|nr:TonB-dependent receptor [Candidatus Acidoferrum sp.]